MAGGLDDQVRWAHDQLGGPGQCGFARHRIRGGMQESRRTTSRSMVVIHKANSDNGSTRTTPTASRLPALHPSAPLSSVRTARSSGSLPRFTLTVACVLGFRCVNLIRRSRFSEDSTNGASPTLLHLGPLRWRTAKPHKR